MPFVIYPFCVTGLLIWASFENRVLGAVIFALGIIVPITIGVLRVYAANVRFLHEKHMLADTLVRMDLSLVDDESIDGLPVLIKAFKHFDLDNSNDIDVREVRSLLNAMYPAMPFRHRKEALAMVPAQGKIRFELFDDLVRAWRQLVDELDPEFKWHGERGNRRQPSVWAREISGRLGKQVGTLSQACAKLSYPAMNVTRD